MDVISRIIRAILMCCLICNICASVFTSSDDVVVQDERYQKGKEKYELLVKESVMPKYSACWVNALSFIESGCKRLSDDVQHRMALKFANCFLMKTGRQVYECSDYELIETCTMDMAPEAYNVYTEFFTHTQNICFFLQAQKWQAETDQTIDRLSDSSAQVAKQIEDSSQLQSEVMMKQNESIHNQQMLLDRGVELKKTLEASNVDVHSTLSMLQEFKTSTIEQKALIFEVFDRLNALQNIVMGEFTGFYSLIFYAVSILVCYLLTSAPRTSSARFWLFLVMTANIITERMVVAWGAEVYQDAETGTVIDENAQMYARLWWCRKVYSVAGVLVWLRCALLYQDLNQINNKLLVEIRKQNADLKCLLQTGTPKTNGAAIMDNSFLNTAMDTTDLSTLAVPDTGKPQTYMPWSITQALKSSLDPDKNSTTGYESDSDTSTISSFNTTMTDRTFTVSHIGDISDSDTESYCTGVSHESSLADELRDLREATPLREMERDANEADISNAADSSAAVNSTRRKRGRPKGSRNKQDLISSPPAESCCSYNLRSNRGVKKTNPNPLVHTESAHDFGNIVRHLAKIAQRNQVKAKVTVSRNHPGSGDATGARHIIFSSDDD